MGIVKYVKNITWVSCMFRKRKDEDKYEDLSEKIIFKTEDETFTLKDWEEKRERALRLKKFQEERSKKEIKTKQKMIVCPNCHVVLEYVEQKFCSECGFDLRPKTVEKEIDKLFQQLHEWEKDSTGKKE